VTRRARDPQSYGLLVVVLVIAVVVCAVAGVAWLGRWLSGGVQPVWPGNPAALVTDLVMGKLAWPEHTGMAVDRGRRGVGFAGGRDRVAGGPAPAGEVAGG
jgi:hypothetical protein